MSRLIILITIISTISYTSGLKLGLSMGDLNFPQISLSRALDIAGSTTDTAVNSIITTFNDNVMKSQNKMNEIAATLKEKSVEFGQHIYDQFGKLLKQRENELKELMNKVNGIDITECTKMSENLELIALAAMSNVSTCIVDKIELGGGYIESLSKISNDVLSNLTNIKNDVHQCSKGVTGSISCAKTAASNAAWIGTNVIPDAISNIGKLSILMGSLPVSMPSCAVSHGYNTFSQQYNDIAKKVKDCVDKKIAGNNN